MFACVWILIVCIYIYWKICVYMYRFIRMYIFMIIYAYLNDTTKHACKESSVAAHLPTSWIATSHLQCKNVQNAKAYRLTWITWAAMLCIHPLLHCQRACCCQRICDFPRTSLHLGPSSCSSCNLMCSCRVHACAFRKARTNSALEGLSSAFTVNERTKKDNKGYTENEQRNL